VYNKRTLNVEESIHVAFDEHLESKTNTLRPRNSADLNESGANLTKEPLEIQEEKQIVNASPPHTTDLPKDWIVPKSVSIENAIGDVSKGISTKRKLS